MKDKIVHTFFLTISWLLLLILVISAYYSFFPADLKEIYLGKVSNYPIAYVFFAMGLIVAGILFVFRLIDRYHEKRHLLIFLGILLIPIVGQLIMLFGFDVRQITDAYVVEDQGRALALGYMNNITEEYFLIYGNNYLLLYIFVVFFKITRFLHIQNEEFVLALINAILLDLALVLEYRTAFLLSDRKKALKFFLLTSLNPFNWLLIYWTYTLNYSIPVMAMIGYLIVIIYRKKTMKWYWNALVGALLGFLIVFGYYLRPTSIFPFIAGVICAGLLFVRKFSRGYLTNFPGVRVVTIALAFVLAAGITFMGLRGLFGHYEVDRSRNFPITHWIMMGLHGDGTFNQADQSFTAGFATTEEMKEANLIEIRNTLKEMGPIGLLPHSLDKVRIFMSNGVSDYQGRLKASSHVGGLYHYIAGSKRDALGVYMMAYRSLSLIMAAFGVVVLMRKNKPDGFFLITVTLFGAFVFYLMWEVKGSYSIPFLYCLSFLGGAASGTLQKASERIGRIRIGKKMRAGAFVTLFCMILTLILAVLHFEDFAVAEDYYQNLSIHRGTGSFSRMISDLASDGKEMTQTFYISKPISRIVITARELKGDATYDLLLTDQSGKEVAKWTVGAKQVDNSNLTWRFKEYVPSENEQMTLSVRPRSGKKDSVAFYNHFSQGSDQYPGDRVIGGELQRGDLNMTVYGLVKSTHTPPAVYFIFWISVLVLEGVHFVRLMVETKAKEGESSTVEAVGEKPSDKPEAASKQA